MRRLLPFNVCLAIAALGMFMPPEHPWRAPVLIAGLASLGLLMIVRRELFARESIRHHSAFWGFNFGETAIRNWMRLAVVVGATLLLLALLLTAQLTRLIS
jgi:hypothetical protein